MRIESLIIDNYRQYQHAEYNFVKTNNANDMHIVLGSNGVGKLICLIPLLGVCMVKNYT